MFKATFTQSVEGIETVEAFVEADTLEEAAEKIELGHYSRYRVLDNRLARVKLLGTAQYEMVYDDE